MQKIRNFFIETLQNRTTDIVERARANLCFWFNFTFLLTIIVSFFFTMVTRSYDVMILLGSLLLLNVFSLFSLRLFQSYRIATIIQACIILINALGNSALTSFSLSIILFIWPVIYAFIFNFLMGNRATLLYVILFAVSVTAISVIRILDIFPANPLHDHNMNYATGFILTLASVFLYHFIKLYDRTRNEIVTRQLESKESRDNILHMVAHDLRNTIGAGVGATDLLKMALRDNDLETVGTCITYIDKSTESSLSIVNDLLESAALPANTGELSLSRVDLSQTLRQQTEQFSPVASNKKIAIDFTAPPGDYFVTLDVEKIKRVFGNLISNAIKFTHPGGKIHILAYSNFSHITVTVKDTGIGIPDDLKDILFVKFSKAGRRGTGGERSFGLGMHIVKSILDVHRANICVISEVQKGSEFIVELPRTIAAA